MKRRLKSQNLADWALVHPACLAHCRSFTYEEFNACQQRHQKKAAEGLAVRNEEVLRSIEDIIELVRCGLGSRQACARMCVCGGDCDRE